MVKRGKCVNYREKQYSPYLPIDIGDIRQEDCLGMIWTEIKKELIDIKDEDSGYDLDTNYYYPNEVDSYQHVDEYEWMPLNFDSRI
ncbi:hypothetical protein N7495_008815 [Penicillium taxi]|uniref:uncharacterized protein n=1 Tax=Penicillium taxi TaxID=168475 RepID=UPI00254510B6|nr:uncharacterized protein N7495_008815 [Penicillium taxi]KAJ5888774.1 hypothetical protein N7495_008815 [Penicillium taxi]